MNVWDYYKKSGYCLLRGFFNKQELQQLTEPVTIFHHTWLEGNADGYREHGLINSAYLTGTKYLNDSLRLQLFRFISSHKLTNVARQIISGEVAFMNTQLFFDPANSDRKNYWHRDMQYVDSLSTEDQKKLLTEINILHFRIPLKFEPGIELIPGTHQRWDSEEEFAVRMEQGGRCNFDALTTGKVVTAEPGDLLIFSANMIHRGLYGRDRMSFDIIFCDARPELLSHVDLDCLPGEGVLSVLEEPSCFVNTLQKLRPSE